MRHHGLARHASQRGAAALILLALFTVVLLGVLLTTARGDEDKLERDRRTLDALNQARLALIDYAVTVPLTAATCVAPGNNCVRPGDLPCPDLNNDGLAEATCSGTTARIGRLPWRTLGLPDLRDGNGERLWYALSTSFKRNPRTACSSPSDAGCLNSQARGTITVRDSGGNVVNDGTNLLGGAIAVVIAPSTALTRLGAAAPQDRSCAGDPSFSTCQQTGVCSSTPFTNTPVCNPINYLDVVDTTVLPLPGVTGGREDNANFADSNTGDGLISGRILDATGQVVVNDTLIVVRYSDLMPRLEQRVAREVLNCLHGYAAANNNRYLWTSYDIYPYSSFLDVSGAHFGRIPDTPFSVTKADTASSPLGQMSDIWDASCAIASTSGWWVNWKSQVFYAIAADFDPSVSAPPACTAGCLAVNPPSAVANKRVAVLVAGPPLSAVACVPGPGQTRGGSPSAVCNYLEDSNAGRGHYSSQAGKADWDVQ